MRALVFGCFLVGGGMALGSCTDPKVSQAKEAVGFLLADPDSAQFSELSIKDGTVCGLVNAKNLMGAYSGANGFIVTDGFAKLGDDSPEFFNSFLANCGEPAKSKFMSLDLSRSSQRLEAATKALR